MIPAITINVGDARPRPGKRATNTTADAAATACNVIDVDAGRPFAIVTPAAKLAANTVTAIACRSNRARPYRSAAAAIVHDSSVVRTTAAPKGAYSRLSWYV